MLSDDQVSICIVKIVLVASQLNCLVSKNIDWIAVAEINVGQMKENWAQKLDLSLFESFLTDGHVWIQTIGVEFST